MENLQLLSCFMVKDWLLFLSSRIRQGQPSPPVLSIVCVTCEVWSRSVVSNSATAWTVAYWATLSMGFSGQGYWSGLPFPSPQDLPDPGLEPRSPALQADASPSEPLGKPNSVAGVITGEGRQGEGMKFIESIKKNTAVIIQRVLLLNILQNFVHGS